LKFQGGKEMPNDGTFYITDDSGNYLPIYLPVRLYPPNSPPVPIVDILMMDDCNTFKFFGNRSTDPDGDDLKFTWDYGDGNFDTGEKTLHAYETPGRYLAYLTVEDSSGQINNSSRMQFTMRVNHPPVAKPGNDIVAAPGELLWFNASDSYDPDGRIKTFNWDFGDGKNAQRRRIRHAFISPGQFKVTLRVQDNSNTPCNSGTEQLTVYVNNKPKAKIIGNLVAAIDEPLHFSAIGSSDTDGNIIAYVWDFGDGDTGKGIAPLHTYLNPGVYLVRLVVVDNSGTLTNKNSDTMKVTINHPPIADAGPNRTGAPGVAIPFNGGGSLDPDGVITSYKWDFRDGTFAEKADFAHIFKKPGTYNVLLSVKDNSGHEAALSFDDAMITINHAPVADAGPDLIIGPDEIVSIDGSRSYDPDGKILSFQWVFSDLSEDENEKAEYRSSVIQRAYKNSGAYTVVLTVLDNSGVENSMAQDNVTIKVNHTPNADAGKNIQTGSRTIVVDGSNSVDADGDPLIHRWDFGDGSPDETSEK